MKTRALYVSTGSPQRPGLDPVGEAGRSFAFEAVLEAGSEGLDELVLGTYEGVRGIYRIGGSSSDTTVTATLLLDTDAAVVGAKWNVTGSWILAGHTLWPLTERGLRSGMVTLIGLDYAFAR